MSDAQNDENPKKVWVKPALINLGEVVDAEKNNKSLKVDGLSVGTS